MATAGPNQTQSERVATTTTVLSPSRIHVLYIDDSENDLLLTKLACEKVHAPFNFTLARSTAEGVSGLSSNGNPPPDLILLDVLTHNREGFELLDYIRCDPEFRKIPLIVYTATMDPVLLARARDLGAHMFLRKGDYSQIATRLVKIAKSIHAGQSVLDSNSK